MLKLISRSQSSDHVFQDVLPVFELAEKPTTSKLATVDERQSFVIDVCRS